LAGRPQRPPRLTAAQGSFRNTGPAENRLARRLHGLSEQTLVLLPEVHVVLSFPVVVERLLDALERLLGSLGERSYLVAVLVERKLDPEFRLPDRLSLVRRLVADNIGDANQVVDVPD